jgi:peptidoglycan/xylan/chitin deacetylase (PgdA/CDA1 family)
VIARRGVTLLLRSPVVNRAVRALARARGHSLVLVYHRVGPLTNPECQVVPSVAQDLFRAQLQALGDIVDFVRLDDLLASARAARGALSHRRLSIAVTFDDDLPSHASHALPILRELQVPAAFFLSGRALHGRGPYWFQRLEALLTTHGPAHTAALLGQPTCTPAMLALACEQHLELRQRVADVSAYVPETHVLDREDLRELAAAGMTIGFHTVEHPVLTLMSDPALQVAVRHGRERLAAAAGRPVRYCAYPHGKSDARVALAVRMAGFDAAFTGRPEPLCPRHDRFAIGRWEPGAIGVDDVLVKLALYLHRPMPHVVVRDIA